MEGKTKIDTDAKKLELQSNDMSNSITTVSKDNYVIKSVLKIKNSTSKGYLEAELYDGVDLQNPNSITRRGRVQKSSIQTLNTSDSKGVVIERRKQFND